MPNNPANTPVTIGFRLHAYGPSMMSDFGGLTGTGVPLAFTKYRTHIPQTTPPRATSAPPMRLPTIPGNRKGSCSQPSTSHPMYRTKNNDPPKTTKPSGVSNRTRLRSPASCRSRLAISSTSKRRGLAVNAQPPTGYFELLPSSIAKSATLPTG